MINVNKVVLAVKDQERAKDFWTSLGYEVVADAPYGAERWLEVRSPDHVVNLVLELSANKHRETEIPDNLPTSNIMFDCDDVVATHRELSEKGVDFPQPPVRLPFGWWAMFNDTEGNRFALGQRGE